MQTKVLQLDPRDNVLIALNELKQGEAIESNGSSYILASNIPAKHKLAMHEMPVGSDVIMYGVLVGKTFKPVGRGELLTTSNVHHQASPFHESGQEFVWAPPDVSKWKQKRFLGYRRSDGQVGTRNYWLVVPLVFCENRNIVNLKQAFEEELGFAPPHAYRQQVAEMARLYREGKLAAHGWTLPEETVPSSPKRLFQNVDGIKFLLHEGGCGGTREDANNLCGLIAGYLH